MKTIELQRALAALGFDPGPIDGLPGRKTTTAVKRFQLSVGLGGSGVVGPKTIAALAQRTTLVSATAAIPLPWLEEAQRFLGLKEVKGPGNNPIIMDWADDERGGWKGYTGDDVPWCGLFISHCVASTLPDEPLPSVPVRAKAWLNWGVTITSPALGAIGILDRPGGGHVFIYTGEDGVSVQGIGGNQGDSVSYAWFARNRVVGWRWPSTVAVPPLQPVMKDRTTGLSRNEA